MTPSIADLLRASGITEFTSQAVADASNALYGNIGANLDGRDWASIMQAANPLLAAQQALVSLYQDSAYLLRNAQHLEQSGYVAAQAEITYRQMADRLGFTHQPNWSAGTPYAGLAALSMQQLIAMVPTTPTVADSTAPTITSVVITSATGVQNSTLNAGDVVSVTVTMSEATTVTGTPQLGLDIGGTTVQASYASGSGSTALVFTYTIQAAQSDANGIGIAANGLSLHGGGIKDAAGNLAILTHGAVADNASYRVDTVPVAMLRPSPVQLEALGKTNGFDQSPQVSAVGSDGAFVVTWHGDDSDNDFSIFVQQFDANGAKQGVLVQLEALNRTDGGDAFPQVSALGSAGAFVVTWQGQDSGNDFSIFVQQFDADGAKGGPVQLEPLGKANGADQYPQVSALGSAGAFVVTWYGLDSDNGFDDSFFVQQFDANGAKQGVPVQLKALEKTDGAGKYPQVSAVGSAGAFVVTWWGLDSDGDTSIFVQQFDASGAKQGVPVQLEALDKTDGAGEYPQVSALGSDGAFVVTWQGLDSGGDTSIFVQQFDANGAKQGEPVQLEPLGKTDGGDSSPQVSAVGSAGAFVVTWYGQDSGGDTSIFVQQFDASGAKQGVPVQLEPLGKTDGEDYAPQVSAVGSAGAFVVTWYGVDSDGDYSIFVQQFNAQGQPDGSVTVNNITQAQVQVQSTEVGIAYLVNATVSVNTLDDITAAADAQWNQVKITAANTYTALPTTGLSDGSYNLYTADEAGNLSVALIGMVTLETV